MQRAVQLPTGPEPGWEFEEPRPDDAELNSVPDSLVVLQSLRQSRSKWVTSTFSKFSTKARGSKVQEVVPPPHSIKAHVHYLPDVNSSGSESQTNTGSSSQPPPSTPSVPLTSLSYVSPALSSKVAIASKSNPVLANLLNAVINRTATDDQIKTLGLLIQSLDSVQELDPADSGMPPRAASPKPFDIVLEFHERPADRWILPRGDVICERVDVAEGVFTRYTDVILTTSLLPTGAATLDPLASNESSTEGVTPEVVSFRLSRLPQQLWELFQTWAGGPVKMEESRVKLAQLLKQAAPRSYLSYRLPEGGLLAEVHNANAPPYTLKPIKPAGADSNRAKRKSVSRRATLISNNPSSPGEKAAPVKRRQSLKANALVAPPIACHSCGQTDVPLMMGGRYCRTCIDSGKAVAEIPQLQLGSEVPSAVTPVGTASSTTSITSPQGI
ncbi:hypothetical protein C8Q80DRAFT_1130817 [Daedaleopsis nitida]|nr:hypothetical protein C8Q80DRAFT_1130817 [Daedaleopsis nitida]